MVIMLRLYRLLTIVILKVSQILYIPLTSNEDESEI